MRTLGLLGSLTMFWRATAVAAQNIVVDGTTSSQVVGGNILGPRDDGSVSGGNLYHSFNKFNVPSSGVIFGTGGSGIDGTRINNIINRVTGDMPSSILGRIESNESFPRANVYLFNPNGIVFGANASLNIGGSFYAATATALAFSDGQFFVADAKSLNFPNDGPESFIFAVDRPAGIINQGNLSVKPGGNISLVGGNVISTGGLEAPNGSVDIAAVPGNSTVVLRSPDFILGLEVRPGTVTPTWTGKITELPQIAQALTGSTLTEAGKVVVNPDGSLQVVATVTATGLSTFVNPNGQFDNQGRFGVQAGDAIVKSLTTGEAQIFAGNNIGLFVPKLQTSGSLFLRAENTLTVRDTLTTPATIQAGGNLILRGAVGIDILAMNFPQTPIASGGLLSFRSNETVLADGYFRSAGAATVRKLDESPGRLLNALGSEVTPSGNLILKTSASFADIQRNIAGYRSILTVDPRAVDVVKSATASNNQPAKTASSSDPAGPSGSPKIASEPQTAPNGTSTGSAVSSPATPGTISGVAVQAGLSTLTSFGTFAQLGNQSNASLSNIADMLLREGRILEAQQTLDLSIARELESYLGKVRGQSSATANLDFLTDEQRELYAQFQKVQERLVEFDRALSDLRLIPAANRSETEKNRIVELEASLTEARSEFAQLVARPDLSALARQVSEARLRQLQADLRNLDDRAVILYPLIRDDRLELILISSRSAPIRRTTRVNRSDLEREIVLFRESLETVYDPSVDVRESARKLYSWLLKPLEKDLADLNAETILYAPYAQLRYIPLAALYDGDRWVMERFRVNNITAASLQDFSAKPQTVKSVLAGAVTKGTFLTVGDRQLSLAGLPFAQRELANLAALFPENHMQLVDSAFSPSSMLNELGRHSVLHLATHAIFRPGSPEDSFILFGDGKRQTLTDVKKWFMPNVDLVVLSACDTAVGKILGNGEEILGFGYLMQQGGARSAIASLWSVDDGGTQALMEIFYTLLKRPNMTKAEALRQAQIALATDNYALLGKDGDRIRQSIQKRLPVTVSEYLSHPYYWAPFIIIGNGL